MAGIDPLRMSERGRFPLQKGARRSQKEPRAVVEAVRWWGLQPKLAQQDFSRLRFQPEIAALQQAGDPMEELTERWRENRLHIFVAAIDDDLA